MLIVYIRTLMPGTVGGDAGELQYAGPLLALVHPTGQPLYVLLGKNLDDAHSIRRCRLSHESAGLTLGLGATIWGQAVLADKYGFNVLLAAWIIGLGVVVG